MGMMRVIRILVPSPMVAVVFFNKYSARWNTDQKPEAHYQDRNCFTCFHNRDLFWLPLFFMTFSTMFTITVVPLVI